jgi:hypothetical protein
MEEHISFFLLLLIGILSIILIKNKNSIFINQFGVFYLVFFSIIPILERINNISYGISYINSYLFATSVLYLFIFQISIIFGYKIKNIYVKNSFINNYFIINFKSTYKILLILYIFLYIVVYSEFNSFVNIYRVDYNNILQNKWIKREILEYFLKPLLINITIIFLIFDKNIYRKLFIIVTLLLMIFPTSIARFVSFSIYGSILLYLLFKLMKFKYLGFYIALINIIGLFSIFFIFDFFRDSRTIYDDFNISVFSGHFDAFQNFCHSLNLNLVNFNSIVSALLFFIPRDLWINKPLGTNIYFGEFYQLEYSNIAIPLTSEIFLTFGIYGLYFGGLIIGFLLKFLDNLCLRVVKLHHDIALIFLIQIAQLLIYLFRGPLLSSFAYFVGIIFGMFLIYSLSYICSANKKF